MMTMITDPSDANRKKMKWSDKMAEPSVGVSCLTYDEARAVQNNRLVHPGSCSAGASPMNRPVSVKSIKLSTKLMVGPVARETRTKMTVNDVPQSAC